ncbi:MAG: isocitrate lyase/phosphoenolpyruvate mutase family protein [Paracoccaceae bacterium]
MTQADKARAFRAAHVKGDPLVLYNIWDAGSAQTVAKAGAVACATGSWSVAAAHGYPDAETLPLDMLLWIVSRITASVDIPVSVDFEGAYAIAPADVQANVRRVIEAGAIGINFEDRVVKGEGLHSIADQATRIAAARAAGEVTGVPLAINARTDLFLGTDPATHAGSVDEAIERAGAYAEAGASSFFVPGLTQPDFIARVIEAVELPVNLMMTKGFTSITTAAELGAGRVSFGPMAYVRAQADLKARFEGLN